MKNTLVKLLLLAALVSCLFVFASCDKLDISLEDASEIFEDEEWIVSFTELDEGLIVARLSADNGEEDDDKVLTVVDGAPAWAEIPGDIE